MSLPSGYGFVPGKSRAKAIKLLAIAEDKGFEPESIIASHSGYNVPVEVLDEFDRIIQEADEAIEETSTDEDPHGEQSAEGGTTEPHAVSEETPASEPNTFDTLAESEDQGYEPSTPDTSRIAEPKLNASHAKWLAYAKLRPGYEDADAELSRDELAAKFGN